jgi:Coenzyme PQQ synthesis protein D (PqqD)
LASARYRINSPHVVAETLDGEATIVDLDSGTYYALNESGSMVWDRVLAGAQPDEVVEALSDAYGLPPEVANRDVTELVERLNEAKLIVPADEPGTNGSAPGTTAGPAANGSGPSADYARPELSTYTDMQELLLLDPIHEVDESGWPSRP